MLGPGRYLLGVAEILVLGGSALLGASRVRERLLPRFEGPPAWLATSVIAFAFLIWSAEVLGTFSLLDPVPYLLAVAVIGTGLRVWMPATPAGGAVGGTAPEEALATGRGGGSPAATGPAGRAPGPTLIALLIAAVALIHFAAGVKNRLSTGMTGFDSTWYHGPFAAGFFQTGNTMDLHFIAPQFLAWFYPANGEIFHAIGMLAFGRDLLSPLLNLGWFLGCLGACWCIGRPYRVGPWSLALGAIALSVPALSDQAGEARNDVVGIFFLLVAVAIALNAWTTRGEGDRAGEKALPTGALLVAGLAAGLAAGTKLNFLLPAGVLVVGLAAIQGWARSGARAVSEADSGGEATAAAGPAVRGGPAAGRRAPAGGGPPVGEARASAGPAAGRALAAAGLAAIAGGGYWYLRNLVQSGNPLPWIHHLGPIDLPAPEQALGGREAHSVLSYLTDGGVWSDWFLPGLHGGLWVVWPLLLAAALAGLALAIAAAVPLRGSLCRPGRQKEPRAPAVRSRGSLRRPDRQKEPRSGRSAVGDARNPTEEARFADPALALAGLVGLATALAWLVAPTSASGPAGMPRGFESGLRYLAPALVLGLALLPAAPPLRRRLASLGVRPRRVWSTLVPRSGTNLDHPRGWRAGWPLALGCAAVVAAIVVGYPVQRYYLDHRYADPTFTTPGLNAAFAWADDVSGARIATTSTRQYPLFGTDLSNRVQYVGEERLHGGFEAPSTCRRWREELNAGHYDYVVTTRDRLEKGKPPYPPQVKWTEGPWATVILRKPPTVVFRLTGPLDPSSCRS